jgi:hypothetical protein
MALILKRASASRTSGQWRDDDFDVLADGAVVGRIFLSAAAPLEVYTTRYEGADSSIVDFTFMKCRCVGFGLCFCALCCAEITEFKLPVALVCEEKPHVTDLGPPHGCDHVPSPHSQRVFITSLGTATSSTSTVTVSGVTVIDLDHAGHVRPWLPTLQGR